MDGNWKVTEHSWSEAPYVGVIYLDETAVFFKNGAFG